MHMYKLKIFFILTFLYSPLFGAHDVSTLEFFDKFNDPVIFVKPDNVTIEHVFYGNGLLFHTRSSDRSIDYRYYYNEDGNLTDAFDSVHHQNIHRAYHRDGSLMRETSHEDQVVHFDYDYDKRLVSITLPDTSGFLYSDDIIARFDPINATYEPSSFESHEISPNTPLSILEDEASFNIPGSPKTFTFDALNRLSEVIVEKKIKINYSYDPLHRKTLKKIFQWEDSTADWTLTATDYYLYHHNTQIAILDDSKSMKTLQTSVNAIYRYEAAEDTPQNEDIIQSILNWFKMSDPYEPGATQDVSMLRWTLNHVMHWREFHTTGKIGRGELGKKVRITYINGMLNGSYEVLGYLSDLSEMHGGANIHYVFRESNGFIKDVIKAILIKGGYVTDHAKELAALWKAMIAEMGGVDGGGTIIHYAHSLGAADTYVASTLLSKKERKMIKVSTFGSPQIIPPGIFGEIYNYISRWDGVPPLGPTRYIEALLFEEPHVIFIKSNEGFPMQDHLICSNTYNKIMLELASKITETFGPLEE